MSTSMLTFALAGALLAGQPTSPAWESSYAQAQQRSAATQKPMAVFVGTGANGWAKVVRDDAPSGEIAQLLGQKYVCVYLDMTTPAGKKLAQEMGITQGTGVVLSDRTGSLQAFWHQGDLTNQSLVRYLSKYADPQIVVRGTETASTTRTSFYPANEADLTWGTMGGSSYCPSCNNARGRR